MWKILFVDDNLDYIDSFAQAFTGELQVEGFRAKDLLATDFPWHKKQYDAALIDLLMPELDGISLWNQIQLKFKIPPCFLSSLSTFMENLERMPYKMEPKIIYIKRCHMWR